MLAMIAMLVLQTEHATVFPPSVGRKKDMTPIIPTPPRLSSDYFSLTKSLARSNPVSPAWPRLVSPVPPAHTPAASSSNSSRGSWSSLFNTGSMRQFMSGMQDTFKEGLGTPGETPTPAGHDPTRAPNKMRHPDSPGVASRRKHVRKDSWMHSSPVETSRSWSDAAVDPKRLETSFGSGGLRQGALRFMDPDTVVSEHKAVVFEPPSYEATCVHRFEYLFFQLTGSFSCRTQPLFNALVVAQFKRNVYAYCELLFRWQMYDKRLELLKAVNRGSALVNYGQDVEVHRIGTSFFLQLALCAES